VKLLLANGANPNIEGEHAVQQAVNSQCSEYQGANMALHCRRLRILEILRSFNYSLTKVRMSIGKVRAEFNFDESLPM
jgi:hypothetical protein